MSRRDSSISAWLSAIAYEGFIKSSFFISTYYTCCSCESKRLIVLFLMAVWVYRTQNGSELLNLFATASLASVVLYPKHHHERSGRNSRKRDHKSSRQRAHLVTIVTDFLGCFSGLVHVGGYVSTICVVTLVPHSGHFHLTAACFCSCCWSCTIFTVSISSRVVEHYYVSRQYDDTNHTFTSSEATSRLFLLFARRRSFAVIPPQTPNSWCSIA